MRYDVIPAASDIAGGCVGATGPEQAGLDVVVRGREVGEYSLANTASAIKYSLHPSHCATGKCLRITMVRSLTLKGRSVVVACRMPPQIRHFMIRLDDFVAVYRPEDFIPRDVAPGQPHVHVVVQ